jgi:hypothetical protein
MPLINVKVIEDVFTPEQKHRIGAPSGMKGMYRRRSAHASNLATLFV